MLPRPDLLIAMEPARTQHVLTPEHIAALGRVTTFSEEPCARPAELPAERLAQVRILLTGWGCPPLTAELLARMPRLALIAHAAGTIKALVPPEAFARGITVTHAAAANAIPVAEYTLAAILMANKKVLRFASRYREARGTSPTVTAPFSDPIGNIGKRVGIVGASLIGRLVLEHLTRFDFEVLLSDPTLSARDAAELGARLVPFAELFATSDVVSLHLPLLPQTRGVVDAAALASMADGATLINTARGAIIDPVALEREAVSGRLDFVLDVTEPEPLTPGSPLYDLPNVMLTPHVAGALGLERNRLGALVVAEIERFVAGEPLRHAVDPARLALVA